MCLKNIEPMAGSDETKLVADRENKAANVASDGKATSATVTVPQAADPNTSTEGNGTRQVEMPVTRKVRQRVTDKETIEAHRNHNQQRRPDAVRPRHEKKRKITMSFASSERASDRNAAVPSPSAVIQQMRK